MPILRCEACGAALSVDSECRIAVCEYCGTKTILPQSEPQYIAAQKPVNTRENDNILILSIPSCGAIVSQKKTFNVYRRYAELVDNVTGRIEQHIDFEKVVKYHSIFGTTMIIFKMSNGQKISIKCLWNGKMNRVLNTLNSLM